MATSVQEPWGIRVSVIEPEAISTEIWRRYVVGTDARIQIALASVLPDRAFDALTRRLLGA